MTGHTPAQPKSGVTIRQATSPQDTNAIKDCFDAYMSWLDEDVSFQGYESEKNSLPGAYSAPSGALLLAVDTDTDDVLGCIAIRPLKDHPEYATTLGKGRHCEMKRLFVYPKARGRSVAKMLVKESLGRAREAGYDDVVLDSLEKMAAARALYKKEGFVEIEPYYYSPLPGTVYLRKIL